MRAELIIWEDSQRLDSGWGPLSEYRVALAEEETLCESLGFVIHESERSIAICQSWSRDRPEPRVAVTDIIQIPTSAIRARVPLELPEVDV